MNPHVGILYRPRPRNNSSLQLSLNHPKPFTKTMFITRLLIAVSLIGLSGRLAIGASLPAWTFIGSSNELTSVQQLSAVITPTTNNFMLVGIYNGGAAAILRLDDAGNKLFRTLANPATPGGMTCGGVAIDLEGNAVVGFTYTGSTTTFTFPNTNFSVFGGFIAKIDTVGNVLWQQFIRGGPPSQIKVDSAGNIYYAVNHTAQLFIGPDASFGAPANAYGSTTLIKLASNGVPIWIRDISAAGYTGTVNTESFSVDNNSVFVTGQFNKGLTWGTNAVTATAYKEYLGRLNAADGSFGWSYIFGLNTSGSDCLVAGGNLWVNGSDGFGTKTIYKFQTNGTLVASVTPPFATGYFRALTNNDFAFIGFGYVHYSNDLSILYATTNLALAKSINLTNYFVYDINPAGDLYVTGNYGDQYGYRSAGKIRAPEYVANITVQPPKITNALTVFMGFTVGLTAAGTPP